MSEVETNTRLETLEVRYSHQEQALEELTRSLLRQEELVRQQGEMIERLERALKALSSGAAEAVADEKPPHY